MANEVLLLNVGWVTSFWKSMEENNYLMLVQMDFPVSEAD